MSPPPTTMGAGLQVTVHSVPKLGRSAAENEDSAAADQVAARFAIADGASTSARPEVWSRLLVDSFVTEHADPLAPEILPHLRSRWWGHVAKPNLPWYATAKLMEGADSTFLGLLVDSAEGVYHAVSLGDSCLFHIRRQEILWVGPVDHADGFGRFPELVSSRAGAPRQQPTEFTTTYQDGDIFLLATDAVSAFLLKIYERHQRVPPLGTFVNSRERFARFVARHRHRGQLANDDTTLCVVRT
ncbi:hypothetical protein [Frankia sp. CiP3]|uniref:hypothetical protein n=1 Tax=Frankia sp. CiP3 TaxID=2880971 RepID=UPI001EF63BA8|nr:hypothetical protein [Frankia sp. CiP3]